MFVEIDRVTDCSTDATGICQAYSSLFVLFYVFHTVCFLTVHTLNQNKCTTQNTIK